jgi:hypothetical protein
MPQYILKYIFCRLCPVLSFVKVFFIEKSGKNIMGQNPTLKNSSIHILNKVKLGVFIFPGLCHLVKRSIFFPEVLEKSLVVVKIFHLGSGGQVTFEK